MRGKAPPWLGHPPPPELLADAGAKADEHLDDPNDHRELNRGKRRKTRPQTEGLRRAPKGGKRRNKGRKLKGFEGLPRGEKGVTKTTN